MHGPIHWPTTLCSCTCTSYRRNVAYCLAVEDHEKASEVLPAWVNEADDTEGAGYRLVPAVRIGAIAADVQMVIDSKDGRNDGATQELTEAFGEDGTELLVLIESIRCATLSLHHMQHHHFSHYEQYLHNIDSQLHYKLHHLHTNSATYHLFYIMCATPAASASTSTASPIAVTASPDSSPASTTTHMAFKTADYLLHLIALTACNQFHLCTMIFLIAWCMRTRRWP